MASHVRRVFDPSAMRRLIGRIRDLDFTPMKQPDVTPANNDRRLPLHRPGHDPELPVR